MNLRKGSVLFATALWLALLSSQAQAHWCDDLWTSSYNIVVRPESDTVTVPSSGTASLKIFVQNNMGYLLPSFKLSASLGGTAITPTAPTLKVSGTLLPGEKGEWTLPISKSGGGSVKIEDITFSVSFGNSGESHCYPTKGANAVMVVKTDGSLYPASPLPGLDSPQSPGGGCIGDMGQGRSLQYEAMADFENESTGLDKLLQLYCAGRGSWDSGSDATISTNCKDASSTSCPTKTLTGSGSKYDYMHLWAAGELAARKSALGARTAVFRARLQCAINDPNVGFAGFAMIMLGYLGDDATAKSFLQTQTSTSGDLGTIAKAALYLMGDTSQQSAVKTGAQSGSSLFVKTACAAALGIVDKDDATVSSVLIPAAKWTEPDTSDNGQGMYASHLLGLVAWDRRGWAGNGGDSGPVTFYGDTSAATGGNGGGTGGTTGSGGATGSGGSTGSGGATSSGGTSGSGGVSGNKDAGPGSDAKPATGGVSGGGASGNGGNSNGSGGAPVTGGRTGSGGATAAGGASGAGGATAGGGATGAGGGATSGGSPGNGGNQASAGSGGSSVGKPGSGGSTPGSAGESGSGGSSTPVPQSASAGCSCGLGGPVHAAPFYLFAVIGLAWTAIRRRRR